MKYTGCLLPTPDVLARRSFLKVGSLSLLGMSLSRYLEAAHLAAKAGKDVEPAKAQSCILIWLEGGPAQMDTWDPKSNSSFRSISSNVPGIQISELLPNMSRHMDKVSIIRSMQSLEPNHERAIYYGLTGHRPTPAMDFPGVGSIVCRELGRINHVPPNVVLPAKAGNRHFDCQKGQFLGPEFDPMLVGNPNDKDFQVLDLSLPKTLTREHLEDRRTFLNLVDGYYRTKVQTAEHAKMDRFSQQALEMITAPEVRQAFDLSQESEKTRDAYGRTSFGQSLLLARRLVESGSRFITAAGHDLNGWDTHSDNDSRNLKQTAKLDHSLPVLLEDLHQRGLLESTVVVAMGEFGRSPHHNSKAGRDHWPHCWSLILGGRRYRRRQGGGRQRRPGRLRGGAKGHHRGPVRDPLQGLRHRLAQGAHEPHRPPREDRQLHRRRNGPAGVGVDLGAVAATCRNHLKGALRFCTGCGGHAWGTLDSVEVTRGLVRLRSQAA